MQMCKWQLDVHNLNQFIAELKRTSSSAATVSAVVDSATELNSRWNKLTLDANEREVRAVYRLHFVTTTKIDMLRLEPFRVRLGGAVVRAFDLRLEVAGSIPAAALSSATLDKLVTHTVQRL